DQITDLLRRVYTSVGRYNFKCMVSTSGIAWGNGPTSDTAWYAKDAYAGVLQDWRGWLEEGIVDFVAPMAYFSESSNASYLNNWCSFMNSHTYNRTIIAGIGGYINTAANVNAQLQRIKSNYGNLTGQVNYSYAVPSTDANASAIAPTLASGVYSSQAAAPSYSWKVNPTKGHLAGRVTENSKGVDGATVTLTASGKTCKTDANGYFSFIDLAPGSFAYTVTSAGSTTKSGTASVTKGKVTFVAVALTPASTANPTISGLTANNITYTSANIHWTTNVATTMKLEFGKTTAYGTTYTDNINYMTTRDVAITGLEYGTTYHVRVTVTSRANKKTISSDYTFVTSSAPSEIIVDNLEASTSGSWTSGTYAGGWPTTASQYISASVKTSPTATCTWTPQIPITANYDVYAWWCAGSNRTTAATYTINHANGSSSFTVNQQTNGAQWNLLASDVRFNAGTSGNVVLTNQAVGGSVVIADAVRFVRKIEAMDAQYVSDTIPTEVATGETRRVTVTFRNTGSTTWTKGTQFRLGAVDDGDPFAAGRHELPNSVATGQTVTFGFYMTFNTAGTFTTDWRMLREGVTWFGDTLTKQVRVVTPERAAQYVSDTIPTSGTAGESVNVSVTFKNVGTMTWTTANQFALGAVEDSDPFYSGDRVPLPNSVAPGQTVTFNFTMTFPYTNGTLTTDWRMNQEHVEWFGDTLTKQISVAGTDTEPPTVPTNLRQTGYTETTATVEWDPAEDQYGVVGYKVYRNTSLVGDVADTSFTLENLSPSNSYAIGIIAYDAAGNQSERSDRIYVTVGTNFFEDGFASLDNWEMTSHTATLSADQNHGTLDGASSMKIDSVTGVTVMSHDFCEDLSKGGYRDGYYSVWFYDPGNDNLRGGLSIVLFNDRGSAKARYFMGVNATNFYTTGVYQNSKWTYETLTSRSVGWHKFEIKVTTAEGIDYYLDDAKVNHSDAITDESLVIRRLVLGYTGAPGATHYYDDVVCSTKYPATPSSFKSVDVTEDSVVWGMTDNSDNASGFNVYNNTGVLMASGYNFATAEVTETGLEPNTSYTRKAKAFSGDLMSAGFTNYGTATTLSIAPTTENVTCVQDGLDVTFTSVGGFGAGTRAYYRYAWTESPEYTFDDSETKWQNGTLTLTLGAAPKYLHIRGYNSKNVANGTLVLGPFVGGTPMTMVEAKAQPNGTAVMLENVTVTAVFGDCYYVSDGFWGIKVKGSTTAHVGDTITAVALSIRKTEKECWNKTSKKRLLREPFLCLRVSG
ncbi:MAG: fibronectin type III domain-containing protein, partial [Abditibacteriota bacterium]|nr:fibronectin type III domain-containing protein [Abditibacteriota bacterium]